MGARARSGGDDTQERGRLMSDSARNHKELSPRYLTQKSLDRTAGFSVEHYSREQVAEANHAAEGQSHE